MFKAYEPVIWSHSCISVLDKIHSKKRFFWLFIYLFKFPVKLKFQILSHNLYNMFHVLSHNRYVGKNIFFDQCIFFFFCFDSIIINFSPYFATWHSAPPNQQPNRPRFDWPFNWQQIPNPFTWSNQVKRWLIPNTRGIKWVGMGRVIGLVKTHLLI